MTLGTIVFGGMGVFIAIWYVADLIFGGKGEA